jgi:hypothetical protein
MHPRILGQSVTRKETRDLITFTELEQDRNVLERSGSDHPFPQPILPLS